MTASWASAIVAIIVMLGTAAAVLWRTGRNEGRTLAILEQLTKISEDHETRLRAQESWHGVPQRRHHRGL